MAIVQLNISASLWRQCWLIITAVYHIQLKQFHKICSNQENHTVNINELILLPVMCDINSECEYPDNKYYHACPCAKHRVIGLWEIVFSWTCAIYSLIFMSIWIPQPMEWLLLPMLLFVMASQCYNKCIMWRHKGAHTLLATKTALLVLTSFNNPHDINWIKLEFSMDEIIFTHSNSTYVT